MASKSPESQTLCHFPPAKLFHSLLGRLCTDKRLFLYQTECLLQIIAPVSHEACKSFTAPSSDSDGSNTSPNLLNTQHKITKQCFISVSACQESICIFNPVSIKHPLCVYSSTPLGQSWAGWPALALRWTGRGCRSAGRGGAGRSERSRGSRSDGRSWRSGRLSDLARSSPTARPPGRCSFSVPRRSCRGRQHTVKFPVNDREKLDPTLTWAETNIKCHEPILLWRT